LAADDTAKRLANLSGKAFFISGAAGDIGSATARALLREGAGVALADNDPARLQEIVRQFGNEGHGTASVLPIMVDIASASAVNDAMAGVVRHFGRLDGALNNAAIQLAPRAFSEFDLDDFRRVLDSNLMGTVHCLQAQVRIMVQRRARASIVNMSSAAGIVALPGIAAYSASKAAILALTRSIAIEYGREGIRANAISPGLIRTRMTADDFADPAAEKAMIAAHPIGRLGTPEDIARTASWLLSDASSYLLGANIVADGGYSAQ
jgi:NAD(P)-dependent dehydrogenase (short-subunit alcohol dehydrogenase family)